MAFVAIVNFWICEILLAGRVQRADITLPNLVKIGQSVVEILQYF